VNARRFFQPLENRWRDFPRLGKRKGFLAVLLPVLMPLSPTRAGETGPFVAPFLEFGSVSYQEEVSILPADSDWDAAYAAAGGRMLVLGTGGFQARGSLGLWGSGEDTESWTEEGAVVQENDLQAWGLDVLGELGWTFRPGKGNTLVPLLGLGYRHTGYERSGFRFFPPEEPSGNQGSVDEDVDLSFLQAGLEGRRELGAKLAVVGYAAAGYIGSYTVDNSVYGDIEGEGGLLLTLRAGLSWRASPDVEFSAAVRYDFQQVDAERDTFYGVDESGEPVSGQVELPENELERLGVEVSCTIRL
jgi:hypothetical protein